MSKKIAIIGSADSGRTIAYELAKSHSVKVLNDSCSSIQTSTGESCPETPTKTINGGLVCDKCYKALKKAWRL